MAAHLRDVWQVRQVLLGSPRARYAALCWLLHPCRQLLLSLPEQLGAPCSEHGLLHMLCVLRRVCLPPLCQQMLAPPLLLRRGRALSRRPATAAGRRTQAPAPWRIGAHAFLS